jgi:hypothetical protein
MMRKIYSLLLIVIYVYDLLITWSSASSIAAMKTALHDMFSMTDMGLLHYFIGLEISHNDSGIKMSQSKYAIYLLDRFHMTYCKPTPTPFQSGVRLEDVSASPLVDCTRYRQLVGSLLYLTHSQHTYLMQLDQFPGTCRSHMSFIRRKKRGFSYMSRGLLSLVYTMQ